MWNALWHDDMPLIQWGVVIGASLAAVVWDLAKRRIPNVLTGTLFVSALVVAPIRAGLPGVADALLASLVLATPYVLLFVFAGGGAGDAKLMGGIGAWLGLVNGIIALFCVATAGTLVAVAFAVGRRKGVKLQQSRAATHDSPASDAGREPDPGKVSVRRVRGTQEIPFGLAIFIGVCIAAIGVLIWRT